MLGEGLGVTGRGGGTILKLRRGDLGKRLGVCCKFATGDDARVEGTDGGSGVDSGDLDGVVDRDAGHDDRVESRPPPSRASASESKSIAESGVAGSSGLINSFARLLVKILSDLFPPREGGGFARGGRVVDGLG